MNAGPRAEPLPPSTVPPTQPWDAGGVPPKTPSDRAPGGPQNIKPEPPRDPLAAIREATATTRESPLDKVRQFFSQSKLLDSNHILEALEKRTGIRTHKFAQIVAHAPEKGEEVLRTQYAKVLNPVPHKDWQHIVTYKALMRGKDLLARNSGAKLPGGLSGYRHVYEDLDALKAELGPERFAAVETAAKQLDELNKKEIVQYYVDHGIWTKEQATRISSNNPHYFPFAREDFHDALGQRINGKSVANLSDQGIQTLDLAGSEKKLDNPLEKLLAGVVKSRVVVAKNDAATALVAALTKEQQMTGVEMVRRIDTGGVAKTVNIAGQPKPNLRTVGEHSKEWDTVSFFKDGVQQTYEIPAEFAAVAKGLDTETMHAWDTVLNIVNAPIRAGAVGLNVMFLPRNVFRDIQSIMQIEGTGALRGYLGGWKAAILKNADFHDAAQAGALTGLVQSMKSQAPLQIARRMGGIRVHNVGDAFLLIPRLVEATQTVAERAGRISLYKRLRAQGVDELDSAIRALNVTVDFRKTGTSMRNLNRLVPFSNAAVQGTTNMLGAIKRHPKRALATAGLFGTGSLIVAANNSRFETSSQIPDYEYTRYWPVILAEGTRKDGTRFPIYVKLPKGGFAGLTTFPVEAMLAYARRTGDRSVASIFLDAAFGQLATQLPVDPSVEGFIPGTVQAGLSSAIGKDIYSRRDIVPQREQSLLPEQQFGPETSRLSVLLGSKIGYSPRKIDYLLNHIAAGAGSQINWLAGQGLNLLGYDPEVYGEGTNPESTRTTTDAVTSSPFVQPLVGTRNTQGVREGYDAFNQAVEETNRAFNEMPDMNSMGIRLGSAGDSVDLTPGYKGGSVELTPQQRAELQRAMADIVLTKLPLYVSEMSPSLTQAERKNKIEAKLAQLKGAARERFKNDNREELKALYSQQRNVAVPTAAPQPTPTRQPAPQPTSPPVLRPPTGKVSIPSLAR